MLEDVVLDQVVGGHHGFYAITLRRSVLGAEEVGIPDFRSRSLIEPNVVTVRVNISDALVPDLVVVEPSRPSLGIAGAVIHGQVFYPGVLDRVISPHRLRSLPRAPVGSIESW